MAKQPTCIDFFCGAGGFSAGLKRAGIPPILGIDIDKDAVATYSNNFHEARVIQEDILELSASTILTAIGGKRPSVIISGSPCQGFSNAGPNNPRDPRNKLLVSAGKLAIQLRPSVFVAENVAGVMTEKHKKHWNALHQLLRNAGYNTTDYSCDSLKYGVAQLRRRVILIAWYGSRNFFHRIRNTRARNLEDVLAGIEKAHDHDPKMLDKKSVPGMIARRILPGQKLCNVRESQRAVPTWSIPTVFGRTSKKERDVLVAIRKLRRQLRTRPYGDADPITKGSLNRFLGFDSTDSLNSLYEKEYVRKIGRRFDLTHTFNGKYRRLQWTEPSLTVDTRFGQARYFLHPDENRGFTIREAARIQGFRDCFRFFGSERSKYRLIGNSVPPPIARAMGLDLLEMVK